MNEDSTRRVSIRTVTQPKDTNALGSIFGGYILSQIDLAAAEHARFTAPNKYVTKVMREVNFIARVNMGDTVSLYTETIKIGRTSVSVKVEVFASNSESQTEVQVTSAEVVMVAINDNGEPVPVIK
jgi:acyl-CoA thioesterase YciA